jgi:hypothetical protein
MNIKRKDLQKAFRKGLILKAAIVVVWRGPRLVTVLPERKAGASSGIPHVVFYRVSYRQE